LFLKQKIENDKIVTQSGYLDLQTDENGQSYAKLRQEGEYITPNEIASLPPPPKSNNSTEEYHMYFVLEKETDDTDVETARPVSSVHDLLLPRDQQI
jgi:hypothetical protein